MVLAKTQTVQRTLENIGIALVLTGLACAVVVDNPVRPVAAALSAGIAMVALATTFDFFQKEHDTEHPDKAADRKSAAAGRLVIYGLFLASTVLAALS